MTDVLNNQELSRYELVLDGELAGYAEYQLSGGDIVFTHTEITSSEREHGLGGRLVRGALEQVRDGSDYRVVAQCPFVASWLDEHPDYQDLLAR